MNKLNIKCFTCVLFSFAILCLSCKRDSWYDVQSNKSIAIPQTLSDYQALLDNADLINVGTPGLGEIASDGHTLLPTRLSTLDALNLNAYTWSNDRAYVNVSDWNSNGRTGAYPRVFMSNLIIEGLNKIIPRNGAEQSEWNYIMGQALFLRGRSFYDVSQIFAPPYSKTTANNDLGIPLRLDVGLAKTESRVNSEKTYEQLLNDLNRAKQLLPNIIPADNVNKVRCTKVAAYALLARIYLSMEEYSSALLYADSTLMHYNKLLDYNNATEVKLTNSRPISILNNEVIFHTVMSTYVGASSSNLLIDPLLYASFETNDLRKTGNFTRNVSTGNITFKGSLSGNTSNFSGLSTGEVYLIKSECLARSGKISEAMNILNLFLKSRWKTGTLSPITVSNENEALNVILKERQKELMLRGLRWSDLRRINRDDRFKVTLSKTVNGKLYELIPNSFKYTFPIPDDVLKLSSITQNTGW